MRLTCIVVATAIAATGVAVAQESGLQEVVITSRKVEEKLQDVPLSVKAFTAEDIVERGIDDLYKVSTSTPGFSFEKLNRFGVQGGGSRPVIRGQSNILGEANASTFIDGLQYNDSILSFPFDLVERIEVIKGPQAALFGRATFAGAINIITKKPTNEVQNSVSTRLAQYDEFEVNAMSRGPVIEDKVFYMVHARYYKFGGMYRNILDGQKVGDERSANFNTSLEFRPNDAWMMRFNMGYGEDNDGAAAITLQDRFYNNCYLEVARQYYCGEVAELDYTEQNLDLFGDRIGMDKTAYRYSAQVEYDPGPFSLTWNTGYFDADQSYGYDVDVTSNSTALNGDFNRVAVSDRKELSSELILRSNEERRVRGMVGAYFYRSRRDFREDRINATGVVRTVNNGTERVDNWAVFGALEADFSDRWTGRVEARLAEDTIGNNNPGARPTLPLLEKTFNSFSPRVTLDYKVTPDHLLYLAVAQGNKPGFINANPLLDPSLLFADEESAWNYEIGSKNTFLDGRMTLNAAAYFIDWSDQQLTTGATLSTGAPVTVVVNIGKTEVKGFELELNNKFTDQFSGGLSFSYNDAEITEASDPEQLAFDLADGLTGSTGSVAGNQTPNSPKTQASAYGKFEFPVNASVNGFLRLDYAYTSKKYSQIFNLAHTGDQNLLNLKLGFETDKWNITLWGDNLTDDRTPSTVIRFVDFKNVLPIGTSQRTSAFVRGFQYPLADKRQFGITASYKF
ncbi:MAG: TonB-dependent receptor [Steroidobacteraceae bacterium]